MAKKTTTPTEETGSDLAVAEVNLPAFMQEVEVEGVDDLSKFQTTPRLTIVQGQSSPDRKEAFGEGGVCVMPDSTEVAGKGDEFTVIPVVFWVSWEVWSDINDTASMMVMETTQDESSDIARRCKSPDTREERYGDRDEFTRKYVESLNFIVRIEDGPAAGTFATLSFNGGEHYTGQKLCGLIRRRNCSIFANRIALKSAVRSRNNRSWYGFDFNNPADGHAVVQTQEDYEELQTMHRQLADMVGASKIRVNREDTADSDDGSNIPI